MMDENGVNYEKSGRDETISNEIGGLDILEKGSYCACEGEGCPNCQFLGYIPCDGDYDVD